jgi:hypothetical protein
VTFSGTIALGHLLVASGIAIHCQSGEVSGTALLGGTVHASALFKECSVLENKFCKIYETKADHEAGANAGNIIASGLGLLLLHAGVHYLKVEGVVLSTIWLGGKLCTLPLENVVSGSTAFKLPTALTELVTQGAETISSATAALLGVQLKYGLENASLDGGATSVKLTGALVGKTFGAE